MGSYIVFALGKFPGMKIDRPGAAIIGAVLMFTIGAVPASNALHFIHFGTVVLLFSMMLVVAHLHLAGFFDWITELVVTRAETAPPASYCDLPQRFTLRVFRQRHHLPGDGSVRTHRHATHGDQTSSVSSGRGDGIKHREHCNHYR
jgi:hypothetical protein